MSPRPDIQKYIADLREEVRCDRRCQESSVRKLELLFNPVQASPGTLLRTNDGAPTRPRRLPMLSSQFSGETTTRASRKAPSAATRDIYAGNAKPKARTTRDKISEDVKPRRRTTTKERSTPVAPKPGAKKVPISEKDDALEALSAKETRDLATHIANDLLRVLTDAARLGQNSRPLQDVCHNVRSSPVRKGAKRSQIFWQAKCATLAFSYLKRTPDSNLQIEQGISALIHKLIALGIHDLVIAELSWLAQRLHSSCIGEVPLNKILGLLTNVQGSGTLLTLALNAQLQTLRLISALEKVDLQVIFGERYSRNFRDLALLQVESTSRKKVQSQIESGRKLLLVILNHAEKDSVIGFRLHLLCLLCQLDVWALDDASIIDLQEITSSFQKISRQCEPQVVQEGLDELQNHRLVKENGGLPESPFDQACQAFLSCSAICTAVLNQILAVEITRPQDRQMQFSRVGLRACSLLVQNPSSHTLSLADVLCLCLRHLGNDSMFISTLSVCSAIRSIAVSAPEKAYSILDLLQNRSKETCNAAWAIFVAARSKLDIRQQLHCVERSIQDPDVKTNISRYQSYARLLERTGEFAQAQMIWTKSIELQMAGPEITTVVDMISTKCIRQILLECDEVRTLSATLEHSFRGQHACLQSSSSSFLLALQFRLLYDLSLENPSYTELLQTLARRILAETPYEKIKIHLLVEMLLHPTDMNFRSEAENFSKHCMLKILLTEFDAGPILQKWWTQPSKCYDIQCWMTQLEVLAERWELSGQSTWAFGASRILVRLDPSPDRKAKCAALCARLGFPALARQDISCTMTKALAEIELMEGQNQVDKLMDAQINPKPRTQAVEEEAEIELLQARLWHNAGKLADAFRLARKSAQKFRQLVQKLKTPRLMLFLAASLRLLSELYAQCGSSLEAKFYCEEHEKVVIKLNHRQLEIKHALLKSELLHWGGDSQAAVGVLEKVEDDIPSFDMALVNVRLAYYTKSVEKAQKAQSLLRDLEIKCATFLPTKQRQRETSFRIIDGMAQRLILKSDRLQDLQISPRHRFYMEHALLSVDDEMRQFSAALASDPVHGLMNETILGCPVALSASRTGQSEVLRRLHDTLLIAQSAAQDGGRLHEVRRTCQQLTKVGMLDSAMGAISGHPVDIAAANGEQLTYEHELTIEFARSMATRRAQLAAEQAGPARSTATFQQDYIEIIPPGWNVISIGYNEAEDALIVSKYRTGQTPYMLRIPFRRQLSADFDSERLSFSEARREMQELARLANESSRGFASQKSRPKGAKAKWWEVRTSLDSRLEGFLQRMQTAWFGGFSGIFGDSTGSEDARRRFGRALDSILEKHLPSRVKTEARVNLDPHVVELFLNLSMSEDVDRSLEELFYFVVEALQYSGERNAFDEIDFDAMVIEVLDALRQYHSGQEDPTVVHTVLILDRQLHGMPWESMPCLRGQSVSRLPSFESLRTRLEKRHVVRRQRGAYILNPSGDLVNTQQTFEQPLENLQNWERVVGVEPDETLMKNLHEEHDILLYFGHGCGGQYIRPKTIRQLSSCPVALLLGCSSGALVEAGEFETYGTVMNYIQAGSPAVLATLWDVTDKDIDRFSSAVLTRWGLLSNKAARNSETSLDTGVAQARDSCLLKYLTGAAPVVYGIPVVIQ